MTEIDFENDFKLGTGFVDWPRRERLSDRYGLVRLFCTSPKEHTPLSKEPEEPVIAATDFSTAPLEQYGQLIAEVIFAQKSYHRGDPERGLYPTTPKVGEVILLGEGVSFLEEDEDGKLIGLRPLDGREQDWLNPVALYKVHNQRVTLYFRGLQTHEVIVNTN